MIWFLLFVVLVAFLMGFFQVPIWIMYGVLVVSILFMMVRNPLFYGKDPEKMISYLKKSKSPYLQFLYHFLHRDLSSAEKKIEKIRSKKFKRNAKMMLLIEKKEFGKAKELLSQMEGHKTKWYALSDIAIQEEDAEAFEQAKKKLKDSFLLHMIEVDQAVYDEKKDEAVALLNHMIPKLRGFKLLAAVQFRRQILEEKN